MLVSNCYIQYSIQKRKMMRMQGRTSGVVALSLSVEALPRSVLNISPIRSIETLPRTCRNSPSPTRAWSGRQMVHRKSDDIPLRSPIGGPPQLHFHNNLM